MNAYESFLLTEAKRRVEAGERRGLLEQGLADLRRTRPTFRQRAAGVLVAFAYRLNPEITEQPARVAGTVPPAPEKPCAPA